MFDWREVVTAVCVLEILTEHLAALYTEVKVYICTTAAHGHEIITHTVKPHKSWKHEQEVIREQLV